MLHFQRQQECYGVRTNRLESARPDHESGRDDQGAFATVDTIVVSHRLIARVAM